VAKPLKPLRPAKRQTKDNDITLPSEMASPLTRDKPRAVTTTAPAPAPIQEAYGSAAFQAPNTSLQLPADDPNGSGLAFTPPANKPAPAPPTIAAPSNSVNGGSFQPKPSVGTPAATPTTQPSTAPRVDQSVLKPQQFQLNPEAMRVVSGRADKFNQSGFSLAQKAAYYSARADFIQSLRLIAQAIDAQGGGDLASQALANGLHALDEAEDFRPKGSRLEADLNLAATAAGHQTPVLKREGIDLKKVSPLSAVQLYYSYAQEQLASSCGGQRSGSMALYGLGKIYLAMAQDEKEIQGMNGPRAMAFFQAAMMADPKNSRASNELGVLLARYGQWNEAKAVLLQSLSMGPLPESWRNLAAVHDHFNETELAKRARYEYELCAKRQPPASRGDGVKWVDPDTFKQTNPGPAGVPIRTNTAKKPPAVKEKESSSWRFPWQR